MMPQDTKAVRYSYSLYWHLFVDFLVGFIYKQNKIWLSKADLQNLGTKSLRDLCKNLDKSKEALLDSTKRSLACLAWLWLTVTNISLNCVWCRRASYKVL